VVPEQIVEPPEQLSPAKTHVFAVGSQQPFWQAVPVVQHGSPEFPHDSHVPLDVQISWNVPLDEHELPTATQWLGGTDVSQQPEVH
jgi:hypothetical protein